MLEQADPERLVRVVLRNDVLIGANLIGDASLARPLRRAVQEQRALASVPELGSIAWRS